MASSRVLEWIDGEAARMRDFVEAWAAIPSESRDLGGLAQMANELERAFAPIADSTVSIPLHPARILDDHACWAEQPLGAALRALRRPNAPLRALLVIHMDTVHARDRAPRLERDGGTLRGPGVADAKGGIAVLLFALTALERSGLARDLGWEVIINPDEELGSPGSSALLRDAAARSHLGLVFEPALPGGALAGARRGSATYSVVVRGRAAHVGRDFSTGRNAISRLCRIVERIDRWSRARPDLLVNVGRIAGGGAVNVVPDLAITHLNVRFDAGVEATSIEEELRRLIRGDDDGFSSELHGAVTAPPKPLDSPTLVLLDAVAACGRDLGLEIEWRPTGGVSDGNRLAAAGLPTVDTLGPRGGGIHSADEHLVLESLTERAKLSALLLLRLANGEIRWPVRRDRESATRGRRRRPSSAEGKR